MRQTLLAVVLALFLGAPAFAQPDITGTWSGTGTVAGVNGYDTGQNVELEVISQSGNLWKGYLVVQGYGHSNSASKGHQGSVGTFEGYTRVLGAGASDSDYTIMTIDGVHIPADSPDPEMLVLNIASIGSSGQDPFCLYQVVLTKEE